MDSVGLKTEHMKLRQKSRRGYKRRNLRGENQGGDLIKMYYMKSLNNKKITKKEKYFSLNTTVLIFLIVVIKYSDKDNLRKKLFILAHSSRE